MTEKAQGSDVESRDLANLITEGGIDLRGRAFGRRPGKPDMDPYTSYPDECC